MTKESSRPPRLSGAYSMESKATVFINGHHKPVHKINDIHNHIGAPYRIPGRSHTVSGHRDFTPRSTDSPALTKDLLNSPNNPPFHASVTSAPQPARRVKSEHGSPTISALPMPRQNQVPPISIPPYDPNAYPYSPFSGGSPASVGSSPWDGGFPDQFPDSYFVSYDIANEMGSPVPSVGPGTDPTDIDWSTYNLPGGLGNSAADYRLSNGAAIPSQPPSYASFDRFSHFSHPDLTSSIGDISELEDFVPVADLTSLQDSSQDALNDFSSVGGDELNESERFRLSSASSYIAMPPARMLASDNVDSLDIDEYMKTAEAHTRELAFQNQRLLEQQQQQDESGQSQVLTRSNTVFSQPPNPGQHFFSVQESQKPAHPTFRDDIPRFGHQSMIKTLRNDPMVSTPSTGVANATHGIAAAEERDDGWVR